VRREAAYVLATGLTAGLGAGHAHAANVAVGGSVDVHGGYGSNPFFNLGNGQAGPTVGATVTLTGTRTTAVSRTDLTGLADVNYYSKLDSVPDNYSATLSHNQRLSERLSLQGLVGYENQVNPPATFGVRPSELLPQTDLLTLGTRLRRYYGSGNFTWEPNSRNVIQGGLNVSHAEFDSSLASNYTSYGGSLGILHTFGPHTRAGIQASGSFLDSPVSFNSQSGTIGLQLMQDIGPIWKLDAGISTVVQWSRGRVSKTLGFNGSLCGNYPRYVICLLGSRSSAPSGLGGLRTETQFGGRVQYKLSERSNVQLSATYDISKDTSGVFPTQKYLDGAVTYQRRIRPRLFAGFAGRYQGRDYGSLYSAVGNGQSHSRSFTGTLNVTWNFGRTAG
jgi:hypothetical protein